MSTSTAASVCVSSRWATEVGTPAAARPVSRCATQFTTVQSSFRGSSLKSSSRDASLSGKNRRVLKSVSKYDQNDPSTDEATEKAQEVFSDLKTKWDKIEDKPSVVLYTGGALVALWFSSAIVGAFNSVPLLPKLLELVGLGYSGWFVYRYLLFTPNRQELREKFDELTNQITGEGKELSKDIESAAKPVADKLNSAAKDVKKEYKKVTE